MFFKNIKICLIMFFALSFIVISNNMYASDCGDNQPCSGSWFPLGIVKYEVAPGCWVSVDLEVRDCGGQQEFRYEIILPFEPTPNNCGYLNYSTSDLKKLIDLSATQNIGSSINPCTEGPTRIIKYEEVSCTFEKICTAQATLTTSLNCNDGTQAGAPGTPVTYTTRTHLPCGVQCCKIEYDVCSKSYTIGGVAQIDRIITNFSKTAITECTSPPAGTTASQCKGCN